MTLNTVVYNKILSYADGNVFSIINNRTYIADPRNRSSTTQFVYRNDPWSKGQSYSGYPYIILRFPKIEKENKSLSGTTKDFLWTHDVTIRTGMGGAVNTTDNTSKAITDMYDIIDDFHETFDGATVKDSLRAVGMYNVKVVVIDNDEVVDENGKHIFISNLEISYNTRLDVS